MFNNDCFEYIQFGGVIFKVIINNKGFFIKIEDVMPDTLTNDQFFLVNKSLAMLFPELDPSFNKFSKAEQEKNFSEWEQQVRESALQVLLQNKLLPIFDDYKVADLYELLLTKLPQLNTELADIEANITQLQEAKKQQTELLSSTFNYRDLLTFKQFDCVEIDASVIKFANATLEWCTLLEEKMAEYQMRQHKLINEANSLTNDLSQDYKADIKLSDTENQLLAVRHNFMFERLSLNMSIPLANLASMKIQCQQIKKQLVEINHHKNGLYELGQLAVQPRPNFDLIAENSATMLTDMLLKMEFYEANRELVKNIINIEQIWRKNYQNIKVSAVEKLKQECEEESIEVGVCEKWLQEWAEKRWQVEQCLQPLIEKALEGGFNQHSLDDKSPVALQLIELLGKYKNKLDLFYLNDRKSIYQKFAFQANSELQEKFEAESELYKYTLAFQTAIHTIVFALNKIEERLWLLRWSDSLVSMTVDVILDFIRDKSLDSISKAVIDDFSQLKLQNYATFINDAKATAGMLSQWDKDYNSLMFKMRKELKIQVTNEKPYKINLDRKERK